MTGQMSDPALFGRPTRKAAVIGDIAKPAKQDDPCAEKSRPCPGSAQAVFWRATSI